jgi:hypothetical protein
VEEGVTAAVLENQGVEQQRRYWFFIAALAGALSLLKGLRLPNRWAATQAQIDYSQGFVKRGFFGQYVAGPLSLGHYARFAAVSFGLLALLYVLVVMLAVKSRLAERLGGAEMFAVFCGCYGISTMANTVGYFDVVLGVLAVAVLFVRNAWARLAVALVVIALGLLIHEMFLFVFVPILALSFFAQGASTKNKGVIAAGVVVLLFSVLVTWRIAHSLSLTLAQVDTMRTHLAGRVDFDVRQDALDVLSRSEAINRIGMIRYFKSVDWPVKQFTSVLLFGPTVVVLLMAARKLLRAANADAWMLWAATLAVFGPILMHALAWDVGRFNGLLCWTAFLVLLVVVRFYDGPAIESGVKQQRVAAVVLLLSLASGGLLMWRQDKMFPYYQELKKFKNQLHDMSLVQIANLSD